MILHNGTAIGIVIAKHSGELLVDGVRAWNGLNGVFDEAGGRPLVVGLRHVRIRHHIVRNVRPQLCSFSRSSHFLQHSVRLHEPRYRYLALFSVYLHRFSTCLIIIFFKKIILSVREKKNK